MKYFRKPWFMMTIMFVGMSVCLPLAWLEDRQSKKQQDEARAHGLEPLLHADDCANGVRRCAAVYDCTRQNVLCLVSNKTLVKVARSGVSC